MFARTVFALMLAVTAAAGSGAAAAQELEGTYVSIDDLVLMELGEIVPIVEVVRIEPTLLGGHHLEVGYLHLVPEPQTLLSIVGFYLGGDDGNPAQVGELDLERNLRVTLRGPVRFAEERLTWTPEYFAFASHEPGRLLKVLSPFLRATQAAVRQETEEASLAVDLALRGVLLVTAPDGTKGTYQRRDPMVLRLIGLIGYMQNRGIGSNLSCLEPLAQAIADAEPFEFSDAALAAARDAAQQAGAEAEATWQEMEERGVGRLLDDLTVAELTAHRHTGRYLQSLIERDGGLAAAVDARWDGFSLVLQREEQETLMLVQRLHRWDLDYLDPTTQPVADFRDALEAAIARYEQDPWSVTSTYIGAYAGRESWQSQLQRLVEGELSLTCDEGF